MIRSKIVYLFLFLLFAALRAPAICANCVRGIASGNSGRSGARVEDTGFVGGTYRKKPFFSILSTAGHPWQNHTAYHPASECSVESGPDLHNGRLLLSEEELVVIRLRRSRTGRTWPFSSTFPTSRSLEERGRTG